MLKIVETVINSIVGGSMRIAWLLSVTTFLPTFLFAQLVNENFEYTISTGNLTSDGSLNWDIFAGSTPKVRLTSGALTYTGYANSGVGNKIELGARGGEHAIRVFTGQSSGTVYVSFMCQFDTLNTTGAYFFHLTTAAGSGLYGLCYAEDDGSGKVRFRIGKSGTSNKSTPTTGYNVNTTLLLVIGYKFLTDTFNDTVKLWINPDLNSSQETQANIYFPSPTDGDAADIGGIVFAQNSNGPHAKIGGVRVATSWSDAPLPVQLTAFTAVANRLSAELRWSTATEVNNHGFEIERRTVQRSEVGGQISAGEWARVGFVPGAGTSTSPKEYTFVDAGLEPGRYAYRIKQVDNDGAFTYYSAAEVEIGAAPKAFTLHPNYPNPFNPSTSIEFTIPEDGFATLKVFNLLGQEVATLFEGEAVAGQIYQRTFDASQLPTGVYVSRLTSGGRSLIQKMLLAK